jgi:hypothetical protein
MSDDDDDDEDADADADAEDAEEEEEDGFDDCYWDDDYLQRSSLKSSCWNDFVLWFDLVDKLCVCVCVRRIKSCCGTRL